MARHVQPGLGRRRGVAPPAAGQSLVGAVHARVHDADDLAGSVDAQAAPHVMGADGPQSVAQVGRRGLVGTDGLIGGEVAFDDEVGFEPFDVGVEGELPHRRGGAFHQHGIDEPVGGITIDAALGLVGLEGRQQVDLGPCGRLLQGPDHRFMSFGQGGPGVPQLLVETRDVDLLVQHDQGANRRAGLRRRQLSLKTGSDLAGPGRYGPGQEQGGDQEDDGDDLLVHGSGPFGSASRGRRRVGFFREQ